MRISAILLLSLFLLGSCNQHKKRVIAVIPKATSHVFWVAVEKGAKDAGKAFNVEIEWNGAASETDFSRQIQIVDSMINRRVDGLALAATERKALVASVDRAMKQGIPVTIFDSGLDTDNYTSYVATNNFEGGQFAARAMAKLIGGKGKVAMVMHVPGSVSTSDRERGFEDVIKREFPDIKIVASNFGMSDRAKSRAVAENFLTANPDLAGIFGSTEPSSVGASLAVKARGLAGKVKVVAFDASESLVEDLKSGAVQAIVVQDPYKMGYETVRTLVDKLDGKTPAKRLDLPAKVIFSEDANKPENKLLLSPELK
ncbi:substrate-binding domain-containing protein [Bryobacter aggregatus]|uniref:ABC transporter substrate-binding protein n=1 Tax=Bryobacter aggregatus TaxID=360054 RepID=UPI00068D9F7A|nr:substrate-binding domain-containing protein [Bryobacter aggregatus]